MSARLTITFGPEDAAQELLRRRRARASLIDYAQAIEVPTRPISEDPDEWMFEAAESPLALHHKIILQAMQACMMARYGRLIIMAPPGSAKSVYASVVAPTWYMGKAPGARVILASYAGKIAEKQSRRARQICRTNDFRKIFGAVLPQEQAAVNDWALTNGSQYMASGLLAGVTGNRAEGLIIDDPVAGREEADSETIRKKTYDAYRDDLQTRLVPGGWCVIVMTRWHEQDLVGQILPTEYDGRSGPVKCRDGLNWYVLRIPAQCDAEDDPLKREPGAYLWPEWFDRRHWAMLQDDPRATSRRTWSSLYQQKPAAESGIVFRRECAQWYDPEELPAKLTRYMASDFAGGDEFDDVTDFTEHGIAGVDEDGDLWLLDWDFSQRTTNVTIPNALTLIRQHRPRRWFGEKGVIEKVIGPLVREKMRTAGVFVNRELLPTVGNKLDRAQAFRDLWEDGRVHLPRGKAWAERLLEQLVSFPSGAHDDGVDVCGLFGRGLDLIRGPRKGEPKRDRRPQVGTLDWITHDFEAEEHQARMARYYGR